MSRTLSKPGQDEPVPLLQDHNLLERAVLAHPFFNTIPKGEVRFLAVPAMLGRYMERLSALFESLGHAFSEAELLQLREKLGARLERAFLQRANSYVTLAYEPVDPPRRGLKCSFRSTSVASEQHYESWVKHRKPPLFGSHPDARVMAVAGGIRPPARILDIGAGTGRNSLPLARLGHVVDAVEPTSSFVGQIRASAGAEGLSVEVHQGDVLDPALPLGAASYRLAIASEVVTSHFRSVAELRALFSRMAELIAPGGLLLFDVFLARGDYEPEPLVRQMSQVVWTNLFTRAELGEALRGLPFKTISETPEYEYERANLPPEAWPPTGWYPSWAQGRDLFRVANGGLPIELMWILCHRH
ncbi:class I SAM-dependent methyltransferase [Tautonia plasticadhaerens]|uniref:Tellurite resistance protein TehB n=1 Tax=Tautonia plasticadhaerens TaxID=2527974 RepID=A0A518GWT9_9BACT|nr:class I SAM-dependent methyltransferase [Tautonia plasticadhaerens]QDV33055.1 tellurite resistance protein TehB [Tautonia plasticadhaerens]